ncbi:phenylalanine--tRNA ligase subunit beta [Candidatus Parcubacteria bacterium]|nr:phenylalanine--tRNA ligase subunit beta [Candidatus Parcubacteria bacterium]
MYLSLNWLKDFVDIPRSVTAEGLGLKLTTHTVEIDDVILQASKYDNIVVGKIKEVKPHPNADKLQLVLVDIGSSEQEIVCGASNIEAKQKVPMALVGAKLPNGVEITAAEIRGVKSKGMLLAEDELGLGSDHLGILILDKNAKVGQNFGEYLGLKDVVYEVDNKSITHRPDLWSHYGMAREVAAFLNTKTTKLFRNLGQADIVADSEDVEINLKVENQDFCPRYMAVVMDSIKIEESPEWLREKLIAVGERPINNIVDITNYVMLELGQPLHAFDARLLKAEFSTDNKVKIGVRQAKKGETITTLDGEKRDLDENMLLITDQAKPVAIAGVMGGENSEINNETTAIVFESANFEFVSIRKTSAALGLRTEASKRFEKALDPNLCEQALKRTIELINKVCPSAKIVSQVADEKKFKLNQGPIELDLNWLNGFIGQEIKKEKIVNTLVSLGFGVTNKKNKLLVSVPTWRATKDVSIKEDLAEEVARIYGYDNLEFKMPLVKMKAPEINKERQFEREVKNVLVGQGAMEVKNYSFVGEEQLKKLGVEHNKHIRLVNPITKDAGLLRQSLATNLLLNVKTNQARFENFEIFEIGNVFLEVDGNYHKNKSDKDALPMQVKRLGTLVAGEDETNIFGRAKGVVSLLANYFHLPIKYEVMETGPAWAKGGHNARIIIAGAALGTVSRASRECKRKNNIKKAVAIVELDLDKLYRAVNAQGDYSYEEFARFPALTRDLAFVVSEKVLYNDIRDEISGFSELIKKVELFDVYQGEKLGPGKKNLAFHVVYQTERTLTGEEVDGVQNDLIKRLKERFEAQIRDF